MDEVSLLIDLITSKWSANATALADAGKISSSHTVTPQVLDIRNTTANKGVRVDLSRSPATIVVFEDSQNIDYPTVHYDIRNEVYSFTMHIRVLHDERSGLDANYGKDRLRAIYLILSRVIESNRTGYTASDGSKFTQLFLGSRSESNDRAKRLFGYKVNLEAKRHAVTLP
jgi:hypothetical protein|tara:strand:+ start:2261 stop:2773 length:513 start_codon:yes stop_codon:yes gene_type:complete